MSNLENNESNVYVSAYETSEAKSPSFDDTQHSKLLHVMSEHENVNVTSSDPISTVEPLNQSLTVPVLSNNMLFASQFMHFNVEIYGTYEQPLFKAKEIGDMLDIVKIRKTLMSLDEDCKFLLQAPTRVGNRTQYFITEQGLYQLLFITTSAKAKPFRRFAANVISELRLKGKIDLHEQIKKRELENEQKYRQLEIALQEKDSLIAEQLLQLKKSDEKLKGSRIGKPMFYYILGKKLGITQDLEGTLEIYRRSRTETSFEWTYQFKIPNVAEEIETIIKNLLFNFREKYNKKTEVFGLDQQKTLDLVQGIIEIFDNPKSTNVQQIDELLDGLRGNRKISEVQDIMNYIKLNEHVINTAQCVNSNDVPRIDPQMVASNVANDVPNAPLSPQVSSNATTSSGNVMTATNIDSSTTNVTVNINLPPIVSDEDRDFKFFKRKIYQAFVDSGIIAKSDKDTVQTKLVYDLVYNFIIQNALDIDSNRLPNSLGSNKRSFKLNMLDLPNKKQQFNKEKEHAKKLNTSFSKTEEDALRISPFSNSGIYAQAFALDIGTVLKQNGFVHVKGKGTLANGGGAAFRAKVDPSKVISAQDS